MNGDGKIASKGKMLLTVKIATSYLLAIEQKIGFNFKISKLTLFCVKVSIEQFHSDNTQHQTKVVEQTKNTFISSLKGGISRYFGC